MALPPGFVLEQPRTGVNLPPGFELEKPSAPPEKQSAFRQIADVPLGIAKGAVQGVRMIADAFGAGSDTSKTIKSAETYLADLMSAQAKNDQQEISRIMKDAEDKGVLDQVKAGIKAFTVAPVDTLSSALGTAAPVIAGALGAKVLGAGALLTTGVSALTGAGMGAGVVKGSIYEETKNALKEAGASEQDAEARAKLAQEYNGKNLDQILLGTVLGGAAAVGPLEKGGAAILARRILGKTGAESTETVATEAAKGAVRRRLEAGALEAVPEAVQAGQEQVATNIALQREGFDVPTFRGAVSAATLEALAGAGLGATVGGGKPAAPEAQSATPETTAPAAQPPVAEVPPAPVATAPEVAPTAPVAETPVTPTVETPVVEAPPTILSTPAAPVAETPPVETTPPTGEVPPAAVPPVEAPPVEVPTQPVVELPDIITAQVLTELGVEPGAAVIKRLEGKPAEDPEVTTQLETYANQFAGPDVRPAILNFVEAIKSKPAPTATPAQTPQTTVAPPAATAPQTLQEFQQRISTEFKRADVRKANVEGNFSGLVTALQQSTNPAIQRIGELASSLVNKVKLIPSAPLGGRTMGVYIPSEETIQLRPKNAGDEETSAHEVLHALIAKAQKNPTEAQKPVVNEIRKLYQYVKVELKRQGKSHYGLKNEREFTAEAMTNPEFQYELMKIPYKGDMNAWSQFVKLIAKLLGIKESNALTEVMSLSEKLAQIDAEAKPAQKKYVDETEAVALDRKTLIDAVSAWKNKTGINMYSLVNAVIKRADRQASGVGVQFNKDRSISDKPWITWIKKASNQQIADLVKEINATDEKLILVEAKTAPEEVESREEGTPGEQAISIVNSLGMGVKPPEPGRFEKAKKILKDAGDNPSLTKESAKKTLTKWLDWFETTVFSSDSAFNNKIRRGIISDFKQNPEVLGMLLEASQSQTVHADALASQFMIDGGLQYNDDLKKWESVKKDDNFVALAKKIEDLATKYNVTKDEMERIAHTYFVAKRLPGIIKRNEELDADIAAERATAKPDRKQIEEWESLKVFVSDEQLAMMEPGLSLVKTIPELKEVVDIWQGIRKNNIDVMVNSGLWSPEYATAMWDNMDYVPYYREEQLEEGAGPQEFIRGLQVKSKEFQLKGSGAAVNDVFDNMIRWSQYAMNRAIRAHKATQMIDAALKIEVDGKPMATKVTEQKRGMNIVRAFRDGKQELYDMADPLFVPAFSSIQNVSIPTLTFMSKVSNVLRQSVVLYPLFSVAQVPQDSFAAMFSSGLKTQHALKIPYLAVKEFIKTLSKTSATHNELTKYGVVGVRDFSATIIRNDAEIYAGLKPPKGGWGKTKEFLEHIAMAADNAVRQAVYEASMQQGLNKSEALEKAFEIINFRRRGTSKMLNVMGQTVPFFYAYLSAQRVAYRVLSGVGISPSDRKEALTTLATTSAAVAALSMIYAMANGDDEDYAETPAAIRDRTLTIPGSGGVRIPLRPDFFLLPKIVAEHTYLMLSDKGFEDDAKFRKSMADALLSAVASPTPFPTAIKPAIEVAINYDFFQGKPLIGNFEKQKDIERQFRDSTSELAKILSNVPLSYSLEKGKFEGLSPIAIDHMIRGMLGSFGGLVLFGTNQFLHSDPDVPRPELSAKEMLSALPGTSGLLKRPQESALKNDFFQLRDAVEKAANTFNDIKTRSPEGIQAFLEDEKNAIRLGMAKGVDKINRHLSDIRRRMTIITNMPESQMSADEKAENIRELRELEREILRSVNVKELREMAKI
jgi:hypothetical protein